MTQEPQQDEYKRGMVVVAHPDDAEFGCAGTVAHWCLHGMEVVYVLCTDGSKGASDRNISSEELVETRRKEQLDAGKVLGLKEVVFLGYEDAYLQPTLEVRRDIARQIRIHRPDVVICQNPVRNLSGGRGVGHPDHLAAGEATLAAVYPTARDHLTFPELLAEGLEPHKVREILITEHEHPDRWIDISDSIDTAIEALKAHKSQVGDRDVGERMREGRRQAGEPYDMAYAEAFKRIRFNF